MTTLLFKKENNLNNYNSLNKGLRSDYLFSSDITPAYILARNSTMWL